VTVITPKTIVVFLPALDIKVDVPIHANNPSQNIKTQAVGDLDTIQVALRDSDIIATTLLQENTSEHSVFTKQ
jgi:hypothetical protein